MVEIKTILKKVATGLDYETVVRVLDGGMANVGSSIQDDVDEFVKKNGLANFPHTFMATHSMGGREWRFEEGREPVFYEEPGCSDGDGWYIVVEGDVNYLYYDSATSGSSLTAEKQGDGTWVVILEVPIGNDGQPYQGFYSKCFHEALGLELAAAV